jgi:hypothetical protein
MAEKKDPPRVPLRHLRLYRAYVANGTGALIRTMLEAGRAIAHAAFLKRWHIVASLARNHGI